MRLAMWMLDVAREQSPNLDHLRRYARLTLDSGFDALGLYFEHRFAYPSTPWSHGEGCVTPEMIRALRSEFPSLRLIPFVNLLGHFEGMIYTEAGKQYREAMFEGLQADPSNEQFVKLAEGIIDDTLAIFDDEIVHLGGDETWQLGQCSSCKSKVEAWNADGKDGKAELYGRHFGPLADRVRAAGRRPAIWGDMVLSHEEALAQLPKDTLIFDWQYFHGCEETSAKLQAHGFEVVGCPALHTYNALWLHVPQSERNVADVARDIEKIGGYGVCVTTWECGLFGSYDTLFPAIRACGDIVRNGATGEKDGDVFLRHFLKESERWEEWARLMGVELQQCGGTFKFSGIRSSPKVRMLLYSNPFLAWMHHGEEFSGEVGERALQLFGRALAVAPDEAAQGIALFGRSTIEFVRMAETARVAYAAGKPGEAIAALAPTRQIFDDLQKVAQRTVDRIGGSRADVMRCRRAKEWVEQVIGRIRDFGDGSLGYLPAFEVLTHPKFMPHDQACWWLINRWANQ